MIAPATGLIALGLVSALVAGLVARGAEVPPRVGDDPSALGGPATVDADGPNAFSLPLPGLSREERRAFSVGNSFFRDNWIIAPGSADGRDGLGPLFNATSCSACHQEDGRARLPREPGDPGMVILLSADGDRDEPHLRYGSQLQDRAVPGFEPEAIARLIPIEVSGRYADGSSYALRRWAIEFTREQFGPVAPARVSVRLGQQVIGLGLLEAVDDATLLAIEDPLDRDGDGISGRAHRVLRADGSMRVGRFGWKAAKPTLEDQVVAALHGDLGITSPARPAEALTPEQRDTWGDAAIDAVSGGGPEIDQAKVDRLAHYCRVLAVPRQRGAGSREVERGRAIFAKAGCADCHRPELRTGGSSPIAALRDATFRPYTDLLLHDMGEGLADHRRDGDANGREWRTSPLWGIGLLATVGGETRFLHDGRAATLEEAILWHGGEAERSRAAFLELGAEERAALIRFLESL